MWQSVGAPWMWVGFTCFIVVLLMVDLGIFHRHARAVSVREALSWCVVWVTLALAFNFLVYAHFGSQRALEFLTGYLIEEALSVDNLFVFIVVFSYFSVPPKLQHRVLFWGILGAIVMRAAFILLGTALLNSFHWIIFVFGAILLLTGFRILTEKGEEKHPGKNPVIRVFKKWVPMVSEYHDSRFIVRIDGKRYATPLLLVLVVIEATDVVFAVDSIPAIFSITRDPFIVFTSNIFAILGLRSLYFVLAGSMAKFEYLNVGLGLVLIFVGVKMLGSDFFHVSTSLSLGVVAGLLGLAVLASILKK